MKALVNRFTVPNWVRQHQLEYEIWSQVKPGELARIRNGLKRYTSEYPVVSIVLPAWNEEKNLLRTLSSFAEMQLPWATELIVVNNNSTDDTQRILDFMGVKSVQEPKQGIAHARLAGLRKSKGTYHLCGDGDSLYPPTWVTKMVMPLMRSKSITCVYGNYSFIPVSGGSRWFLGMYELLAEGLFEYRRMKREFLNVRGANFGFRRQQGLDVKGFEMAFTRVFDNDQGGYVVYGEDGRMGRKLGEIGSLKLNRFHDCRIWTSSRRLLKDGSLANAFAKRIKLELGRVIDYTFGPKKVRNTTDTILINP